MRPGKINIHTLVAILSIASLAFIVYPLAAQGQKLESRGKLIIKGTQASEGPPYSRYGLVLKPQTSTPAGSAGRIYYNGADNKVYLHNGTSWNVLGGAGGATDRYVATRIMAASDSLGSVCAPCACPPFPQPCSTSESEGTCCTNPRADYTANGIKDQNEMNIAITEVNGNGGGSIYLLEGTYFITDDTMPVLSGNSGITPRSNISIIGSGRGTVLKIPNNENSVSVFDMSVLGSINNLLISQLRIDGNKAGLATGSRGIYLHGASNCVIDKVWIENIKGDPAVFLDASSGNIITNNIVRNNEDDSNREGIINLEGGSSKNFVSGNDVRDNIGTGIYIGESAFNTVSHNNVQNNTGTYGRGIYVYEDAFPESFGSIITGNNVESNTAEGIYFNAMGSADTGSIITGNNIRANNYGIRLGSSTGNVVSANLISENNLEGIYMGSSTETNTITGNILSNNGGVGGTAGINASGADYNFFSFNHLSDPSGTGYGINITSAGDNNYLAGNHIIDFGGYAGRLINDASTPGAGQASQYMDKLKINLERVVPTIMRLPAPIPNDSTLDVTTHPKSYIVLNMANCVVCIYSLNATRAIAEGSSVGDLLILEGTGTASLNSCVNVPSSSTTAVGPSGSGTRTMCAEDVLTLIWNGSKWVEMSWADN